VNSVGPLGNPGDGKMKKIGKNVIVLIFVLALMAPCIAGAEELDVYVGADALLYVYMNSEAPGVAGTNLARLMEEPEIVALVDYLKGMARKNSQLSAESSEISIEDLSAALSGEVAFAVLMADADTTAAPSANRPMPSVVALIRTGGEDSASARAIAKVEKTMIQLSAVPATKKMVAGVEVTVLEYKDLERKIFIARKGDIFMVALGGDAIEKTLAHTNSLGENAVFKRIRKSLGASNGSLFIHYNHQKLMDHVNAGVAPMARPVIDALGLNSLLAVDVRLAAEGKGYKTSGLLSFRERKGIFSLADGAVSEKLLKMAPRASFAVIAASISPRSVYRMIAVAANGGMEPPDGGAPPIPIVMAENMLGLSVEKDILRALGGQYMLIVTPGPGIISTPAVTVVAELKDVEAFMRVEKAIVRLLVKGIQAGSNRPGGASPASAPDSPIKRMEFENCVIRFYSKPGGRAIIVPSYTIKDKHFIFSTSPQALKNYLLFLKGTGPDITASEDFKTVAAKVFAEPEMILYMDTMAVFKQVYSVVPMLLGFMGEGGMGIMGKLPPVTLFDKYLFGAICVLKGGADSIRLEAYSPTGMREFAVLAPVGAGLMIPALVRARAQARSVSCRSNLRQIGLAIAMYSADNGGAAPQSLNELVTKKYLSKKSSKALWCPSSAKKQTGVETNYVYRKEFADVTLKLHNAAGEPVVWDNPHEGRHGDTINVLYNDGSVRSVNIKTVTPPKTPNAKQWPALIKAMKEAR